LVTPPADSALGIERLHNRGRELLLRTPRLGALASCEQSCLISGRPRSLNSMHVLCTEFNKDLQPARDAQGRALDSLITRSPVLPRHVLLVGPFSGKGNPGRAPPPVRASSKTRHTGAYRTYDLHRCVQGCMLCNITVRGPSFRRGQVQSRAPALRALEMPLQVNDWISYDQLVTHGGEAKNERVRESLQIRKSKVPERWTSPLDLKPTWSIS
jgi:hypothetical protein